MNVEIMILYYNLQKHSFGSRWDKHLFIHFYKIYINIKNIIKTIYTIKVQYSKLTIYMHCYSL